MTSFNVRPQCNRFLAGSCQLKFVPRPKRPWPSRLCSARSSRPWEGGRPHFFWTLERLTSTSTSTPGLRKTRCRTAHLTPKTYKSKLTMVQHVRINRHVGMRPFPRAACLIQPRVESITSPTTPLQWRAGSLYSAGRTVPQLSAVPVKSLGI